MIETKYFFFWNKIVYYYDPIYSDKHSHFGYKLQYFGRVSQYIIMIISDLKTKIR